MKYIKHTVCIALILVMLFTITIVSGYAAEPYFTIGNYYCSYNDHGITINAFYDDSEFETLIIPSSLNNIPVTELGVSPFTQAKMAEVIIPDSIQKIGLQTFWGCENLKTVTLLTSDAEMMGNPFLGCKNLKRFIVPADNSTFATIDGILFNKVEKKLICYPAGRTDESYEVPAGIKTIGRQAFSYSVLKEIKMPDTVECFEEQVFSSCNLLEKVNLPGELSVIKNSPFYNCISLKAVDLSENNPVFSYDGQFLINTETKTLITCFYASENEPLVLPIDLEELSGFSCANLPMKTIQFPAGLKQIGNGAFYTCPNLEAVTLPDGITNIEPTTFYSCSSLFEVSLPDTLKSIGEWAFSNCTALDSIRIPPSVEEIGTHSFTPTEHIITLLVTAGSYAEMYALKAGINYETTVIEDTSWLN